LKVEPAIQSATDEPLEKIHNIAFENVSYTHENSAIEAIKNLSFTIKSGETLGAVGRTGSRKSTLLNVIMRQIDPSSGVIKVNQENLKDINLNDYHKLSGVVPQEVFLFSDSIRNNIQFGVNDREVTEEEIIEISKKAYVYHNIIQFKEGFDTVLGERGVN